MRRTGPRILLLGAAVTLAVLVAPPTAAGPEVADEPPTTDDVAYADYRGISLEEAKSRSLLELLAGELDAALSEGEPDAFGGLWIEHEPEFRVVVAMLAGTEQRVDDYISNDDLSRILQVHTTHITLEQLQRDQELVDKIVALGVEHVSMIDVEMGQVEVWVDSPQAMDSLREKQLPRSVRLDVESLPTPSTDIYGGLSISNGCTTGFSVEETNGFQQGVTTAGHCGNTAAYLGQNLPFQAGQYSGSTDAQWHTTPNLGDPNKIFIGSGTRLVTSRVNRNNTAQGMTLCKYGRATGYGCGTMTNKNVTPNSSCVPNANATWMWLYNGSLDLAETGDSGGPVFKDNAAYGTISCQHSGGAAIYMAQNYLSNIGVRVDTG